ncbi:AAA family ATPase [Patescibacteria group bacterium]|nr:AAA family ATPase [Patescibacteria group bacterium]
MIEDLNILKEKINNDNIPQPLRERIDLMIGRLERMSKFGSYSADYEVISRYINVVTSYPWNKFSTDNLNLENAKEILNKDHYGIEGVKERILEYIAVMNLNREQKAPILCFVGLQGIGKTTMAQSIAKALGRKFTRISLGGAASSLEFRGQSKANPDAEEGAIVKAMIRVGTSNPVILLDEVDKISDERSVRSSIMAVLLEVLDPEQNSTFVDHYMDYPIDISSVFFILTANNVNTISAALLDRLEIVRFTSYNDEEKKIIAQKYLMSKVYKNTNLTEDQLVIEDDIWPKIIRPLGYEAGIRELERTLMAIGRKVAKQILLKEKTKVIITTDNLKEYLPIGF